MIGDRAAPSKRARTDAGLSQRNGTTFCPVCKIQINSNPKSVVIHQEGRKHQRRAELQQEEAATAAAAAGAEADPATAVTTAAAGAGCPSRPMPKPIAADGVIDVVFRDEHLVCLNKPANLLCVPGRASTDSLKSRVRAHGAACFSSAEPVHRLDQETSGVLLMGLSSTSCSALCAQFASRTVRKRYVAVVDGLLQGDAGSISLALRPDLENRPRQLAVAHEPVAEASGTVEAAGSGGACGGAGQSKKTPKAKAAYTEWRVLDRLADRTLVELTPRTGRTHQLRVHMAAIGHPILGDTLYAPPEALEKSSERLLLHSLELVVQHPCSGDTMTFRANCPFSLRSNELVPLHSLDVQQLDASTVGIETGFADTVRGESNNSHNFDPR